MKDVAIVGSGFGAAVMAARIGRFLRTAAPTRTVLVLEKGDDPTGQFDARSNGGPLNAQGNRFRHTLAPDYLAGVAELHSDPLGEVEGSAPSMTVAAGRGIGGGSNVYCGVSLRAPQVSFDQVRGGHRLWPPGYSRAALDPWYQVVEQELRVRQLSWTDAAAPHWQLATRRDLVFAEGCRRIWLGLGGGRAARQEEAERADKGGDAPAFRAGFGGRRGHTSHLVGVNLTRPLTVAVPTSGATRVRILAMADFMQPATPSVSPATRALRAARPSSMTKEIFTVSAGVRPALRAAPR